MVVVFAVEVVVGMVDGLVKRWLEDGDGVWGGLGGASGIGGGGGVGIGGRIEEEVV